MSDTLTMTIRQWQIQLDDCGHATLTVAMTVTTTMGSDGSRFGDDESEVSAVPRKSSCNKHGKSHGQCH